MGKILLNVGNVTERNSLIYALKLICVFLHPNDMSVLWSILKNVRQAPLEIKAFPSRHLFTQS